jgi:nucleoside-diphosphate-sugar epimerase
VVGENATINRITNAIAKEVPDVEVIVTPTPNLNQVSYELDASRIAKLGFHPQHDLEGGVREIVDRFRGLLKKRRLISIGRDHVSPVPELRDA